MLENKIYKISILGPQACGKGTQAEFLSDKLKIPAISVGQILREELKKGSTVSEKIKEEMNAGGLVSNAIINLIVKKRLTQSDAAKGFIFDGFPRIRIQAKSLATLTALTHVIVIEISDAEALSRLSGRRTCSKCGKVYHLKFSPPKLADICDDDNEKLIIRTDDTPEIIHERLKIYHAETEEVIEFYEQQGIVIHVNGEQSIDAVKEEMFRKLKLNS